MTREEVLEIFKKTGGLLEGHFVLTSGLHSSQYFQCAKVLQYPVYAEKLCGDIAGRFKTAQIEAVIAPAMGGIVVAQEVGRQLGVRTMFAERKDGTMQLRRGFEIRSGERVLVCEDVVTTGGSVQEVLEIVGERGGVVAGVGYVVDRSGGTVVFASNGPVEQHAVLQMEVVAYSATDCPLCAKGLPFVKPGSRASS